MQTRPRSYDGVFCSVGMTDFIFLCRRRVLGEQHANLPRILGILADVLVRGTDLANEDTLRRMIALLQHMRSSLPAQVRGPNPTMVAGTIFVEKELDSGQVCCLLRELRASSSVWLPALQHMRSILPAQMRQQRVLCRRGSRKPKLHQQMLRSCVRFAPMMCILGCVATTAVGGQSQCCRSAAANAAGFTLRSPGTCLTATRLRNMVLIRT